MEPIRTISGACIVMPQPNIDTDQIIPARFLKGTSREGFGQQAFFDKRHDATGSPIAAHPFNMPGAQDRPFLIAGQNFGCGSSREHAPWALSDFGIKAIIAPSIADIFSSNALKNGLLPAAIAEPDYIALLNLIEREANTEISLDLGKQQIQAGSLCISFPLDSFSRHCLLQGLDPLGYLLQQEEAVSRYEEMNP